MKTKCLPQFTEPSNSTEFSLKNCIHPCLEKIGVECVPNDIIFHKGINSLLITGPSLFTK